MKLVKRLAVFVVSLVGLTLYASVNSSVYAAGCVANKPIQVSYNTGQYIEPSGFKSRVTITRTDPSIDFTLAKKLSFRCSAIGQPQRDVWINDPANVSKYNISITSESISFDFDNLNFSGNQACLLSNVDNPVINQSIIWVDGGTGDSVTNLCEDNTIQVTNVHNQVGFNKCKISTNPAIVNPGVNYTVSINNLPTNVKDLDLWSGLCGRPNTHNMDITVGQSTATTPSQQALAGDGCVNFYVFGTLTDGSVHNTEGDNICSIQIKAGKAPTNTTPTDSGQLTFTELCDFTEGTSRDKCEACAANQEIYTPFGCISANPQDFIQRVLQIAIGIAGGIAFLMMLYAGFMMMMSGGNPEKLNSGKEVFVSAIAGLLLIIFSAVILRIIGVDILQIPGFG